MRFPVRTATCARQKGICLTVMAIPLFISVYLLIFLNLDIINMQSGSNNQNMQSRHHAQSLVRMQRAVDDLHYDLSQVINHRDSLLRHIISISRNISLFENIDDVKAVLPAINTIEKYPTYVLQSIVRYKPYMLTCDQLNAVQIIGNLPTLSSDYSDVFHGLYGLEQVFVIKPRTDMCMIAHGKYDDKCLLSVNYRVTQDILLLQQIRHPNIVRLLGYCCHGDNLLYVTESGRSLDLKNVTRSNWSNRLKVLHSIATIFYSLGQSPVGFLSLNISDNAKSPSSIFLTTPTGHVKLASASSIVHTDPSCTTDSHCRIRQFTGIKCRESQCKGYNVKKSHLDLMQYYLEPILENSPEYIRAQVKFALQKLSDMPLVDIVNMLGKWREIEEDRQHSGSTTRLRKEREKKLRDLIGRDGHVVEMSDIIDSWPAGPGDMYKYEKLEKTDMPAVNDYACPRTLFPWGCVHTLHKISEAFMSCNGDPQCRAMVVYPSKIKPGWLEVVFKSGTGNRVLSEITTLYIKHVVSNTTAAYFNENIKANQLNTDAGPAGGAAVAESIPASMIQPCLDDMFHMQQLVRSNREKTLMKLFDLQGATEEQWRDVVSKSAIDGSSGTTSGSAPGGQTELRLDNSIISRVTLVHTEGTANNYIGHLAMYHLDRILGLFSTIPTSYRRLTELEIKKLRATDPSFNKLFSPLIRDSSIDGVLLPPSAGSTMKLTLSRFNNFTDSVIPLTSSQRRQLEYLLLLWLSGTPRQLSHINTYRGLPLHLISTDTFQQGVDDILPYFYNCQFPRHTVEILWSLQDEATDYCTLASQLLYELQTDGMTPQRISDQFKSAHILVTLVNKAAETLIHIIDTCVDKFTEAKVLYV